MSDEEKDYPGRVAYEKSGESIRLAFKTTFETVHHGMTFESRKKSIREEKARHDMYEKRVATHSFQNYGRGEFVCYTIIVCSNIPINKSSSFVLYFCYRVNI